MSRRWRFTRTPIRSSTRPLKSIKKVSTLDAKQFKVFYAAGGHGTIKDFLTANGLHSLAAQIYAQGRIVAAVCHGPVVLPGVKDADGHSIVKGKTVTGFTDAGGKKPRG
jgi:putative intracellular protease/amidase